MPIISFVYRKGSAYAEDEPTGKTSARTTKGRSDMLQVNVAVAMIALGGGLVIFALLMLRWLWRRLLRR